MLHRSVERRAARAEALAEAMARAARERMERRSACVEEHPVEVFDFAGDNHAGLQFL